VSAPSLSPSSPASPLELLIVTGLSGSGISTALQALEDDGYFCVDNLPPPLISTLTDLARGRPDLNRLAVGLDARNIHDAEQALQAISALSALRVSPRVLFLEAVPDVLQQRFSASRRPHPLSRHALSLTEAMAREVELMGPIRAVAHVVLDTTSLSVHDCKRRVREIATGGEGVRRMVLQLMSFGFRHGVPREADLVWDVRFLPNPHFDPALRPLSGLDAPVRDFVLGHDATRAFLAAFTPLLNATLPAYVAEGKAYLTLAIGCTGGHHRSVAVVESLRLTLLEQGWAPKVSHRDLHAPY
jgi:UPF0042 nucleotide-binding protein